MWMHPASKNGLIQELSVNDRRGCSGIDVKVPGTENLEILVWVNACTNEIQHCRQIVAINTVILKENPDNETSTSSGKLAARDVAWEAKEDLEQEPQSLMKIIWSIVPCARDLPYAVDTSFSKKTAFLTRQSGKREDDRPCILGRGHEMYEKLRARTKLKD